MRLNLNTLFLNRQFFTVNCWVFFVVYFSGLRLDQWPLVFILPFLAQLLVACIYSRIDLLNMLFSRQTFRLLLVANLLGYLLLMPLRYYSMGYNIWDLGCFSSALHNYVHGNGFYNSVMSSPQLADHFSPVLLLFAPLFQWKATFMWLVVVKYLLFFGCLFPLQKLCLLFKLPDLLRYFILILWLLCPATNSYLQFELQPSSFTPFLILWAFYFWFTAKYACSILLFLFLLLFKEHMALVLVSLGVFEFLISKKPLKGTLLAIIGSVAGIVIMFVLTPYFAGVPNLHHGELDPLKDLPAKLEFFLHIGMSVAMLIFFDWRLLLFVLPAFAASFLSGKSGAYSMEFHYHDIGITLLFIAICTYFGAHAPQIATLQLSKPYKRYVAGIGLVILFSACNYSVSRQLVRNIPDTESLAYVEQLSNLSQRITSKELLYAQCNAGAYLSNCYGLKALMETSFLEATNSHYVVLAPGKNAWPFTNEQLAVLQQQLQSNHYLHMDEYLPLQVFYKPAAK